MELLDRKMAKLRQDVNDEAASVAKDFKVCMIIGHRFLLLGFIGYKHDSTEGNPHLWFIQYFRLCWQQIWRKVAVHGGRETSDLTVRYFEFCVPNGVTTAVYENTNHVCFNSMCPLNVRLPSFIGRWLKHLLLHSHHLYPPHLSSSTQTILKVPDIVTVMQFNSGAAHPTADSSPETVAAGLAATAEIMHRNASISHLAVLRASLVTAASAPQYQLTEQALQVWVSAGPRTRVVSLAL